MWVYALLLAAARAGALPQRARAMCEARARGVASLRQLFSEFVLQGCVCRRAREKLRVFAQRGVAYTRVGDRDTSPRWRTLRGAVCRLLLAVKLSARLASGGGFFVQTPRTHRGGLLYG